MAVKCTLLGSTSRASELDITMMMMMMTVQAVFDFSFGQEDNAPSHTSRRTKAFLKERDIQLLTWPPCSPDLSPLDFHLWQAWETALGERQFQSQLELLAMITRTLSDLDPEATEQACTARFIHRCLACVRARGGHFERRL